MSETRGAGFAWAAAGGALCAAMAPLEPNLLEEGLVLHVAERLLSGEHLYRDIRLVTGPVPYAIVAALFGAFGKSALVARAGVVALHALACGSVYGLARRSGAGDWSHAAAASLAAAPVLFFPLLSTAFYTTFATSLVFVAAGLGLRGITSSRSAFLAGVAVALTALSKQSLGAVLAVALLGLLAVFTPVPRRVGRVLAFCGGGAVVAVISLAVFGALGDLASFVTSLVETPRGAVFGSPFIDLWPPGLIGSGQDAHQYTPTLAWILDDAPGIAPGWLVLVTQLLYALPFAVLIALLLCRVRGPVPPGLWALGAATLALATNLFPRPDAGHLSFAAPAALAMAFALAPALAGSRPGVSHLARALALGVAVLALVFGGRLWARSAEAEFGERVRLRPVSLPMRTGVVPRVLRYIEENRAPDEPIYVARTEPLVYFATGAPNPTPFTGLLQVWGLRGEQEPRTLEALEDVRLVVMSDADEPLRTWFRDEQPAVQRYLERHFEVSDPFRGRLHPEAWLLVLERSVDRGATAVDLLDPALAARAWRREGDLEIDDPAGPERSLPTRKNRRPLAVPLGSSGGGVDFDLELPGGALRFQAGVGYRRIAHLFQPDATDFRVSVSEGGAFEPLGSRLVEFGRFSPGSDWLPFEVDLSRFAGRRVTLRLEAIPHQPGESGAVAIWGSPRLARPADPLPSEGAWPLAIGSNPRPLQVEAAGETRMAVAATPPFESEVCFPESVARRHLELGASAKRGPATVRVRLPDGASRESVLGREWTDVRVRRPRAAGCARIEVSGDPEARASLSTPLLLHSGARRPWVVIYVIDTFRADFSPYAGAPEEAAPALASFARVASVFPRAFATSSWTRPTAATLLTGLGPSRHRVFDRQDALPAGIPRLPEWLSAAGWHSVAFSTNPNVLPTWGFMSGFHRFVDASSDDWWDEEGLAKLAARLDAIVEQNADRPLFLYVHDNQPHVPYTPSPRYRDLFGAAPSDPGAEFPRVATDSVELAEARRLYAGELRSTSDRFGAFVTAMKRVGRFEDSLVVLVGDHGELFGEHGELLHGRALYEEEIRVPLAIKTPGSVPLEVTAETAVSTEDVVPTILASIGIEPPDAGVGAARLERTEPRSIIAELGLDGRRAHAAIRWPWKYLRVGEEEWLFDLESDPRESSDLAEKRPEVLALLRQDVERRRAGAAKALWIQCVAGTRAGVLRVEIESGGSTPPIAEGVGLEPGDGVEIHPGRVSARLKLRSVATVVGQLSEFDPVRAAYRQPDRDGVRVTPQDPERMSVQIVAEEGPEPTRIGPDDARLPPGSALRVADVQTPIAPTEPKPAEVPVCRLSFVVPPDESTPAEAVSPQLRDRLRALGYLE